MSETEQIKNVENPTTTDDSIEKPLKTGKRGWVYTKARQEAFEKVKKKRDEQIEEIKKQNKVKRLLKREQKLKIEKLEMGIEEPETFSEKVSQNGSVVGGRNPQYNSSSEDEIEERRRGAQPPPKRKKQKVKVKVEDDDVSSDSSVEYTIKKVKKPRKAVKYEMPQQDQEPQEQEIELPIKPNNIYFL